MAPLYIFPDTNLLMHFRRIDELNWGALSGRKTIVVVLAPAVLKELGKHKDQHPVRKLRQRARDLSAWLRKLRKEEDRRLKNGATLEVATREPTRFLTDDLDPTINDDRIIASALAYAADGKAVAVATDDTIFLHKLDAHGIEAIEVPEELRLPDELDESELEAKALRKQLAEAKGRTPALDLVWAATDSRSAEIIVVPPNLEGIASPSEMAVLHPPKLKRGDRAQSRLSGFSRAAEVHLGITDGMIDRYNAELATFARKYQSYYAAILTIADLRRRYIGLCLRLKNMDQGSATYIQASVRFPAGMTVIDQQPDFTFPKPPAPPEMPGSFGLERPAMIPHDLFRHPRTHGVDQSMIFDPDRAVIDEKAGTVRWRRERLLHGLPDEFELLHCVFAPELIGATAMIDVELHAEELAAAEHFQLEVRISERDPA